jgi:hypothetical protein
MQEALVLQPSSRRRSRCNLQDERNAYGILSLGYLTLSTGLFFGLFAAIYLSDYSALSTDLFLGYLGIPHIASS